MRTVVREHPGARLLVAGRGDPAEAPLIGEDLRPTSAPRRASEEDKAAFLRSVDVYCAPNLLGESFGVVLIEALAAGAPIVASDLDAFARVLEHGEAACWSAAGTRRPWPRRWRPLGDPARRAGSRRAAAGGRRLRLGTCSPGGSWPSTRPWCRPAAARSAGEDDDLPGRAATVGALVAPCLRRGQQ